MMEALGIIGFIGVVLALAWTVLMFCIPFMILSMSNKLSELIMLQKESNRINGVIGQNVYAHVASGGSE